MLKEHNVTQGTDEWHALRNGIITASEVKLLVTPTGKIADNDKTRAQVFELAAQRISGRTEPSYISDDMLRGIEEEPDAIEYYEFAYEPVKLVGFYTATIEGVTVGYSPDGVVGDDGLVEVKCPRQKAHIKTLLEQKIPDEYKWQLQFGLLVTGRKWIDYVSYHNGLPLVVLREYPDDVMQETIKEAVLMTEEKIQSLVKVYNQMINDKTLRLVKTEYKEKQEII